MTEREKKARLKRERYFEAKRRREQKQEQKLRRGRILLCVLRVLGIIAVVGFFCAALMASGLTQLLCILGALWAWTAVAWANWRLYPNGKSDYVSQKSGIGQVHHVRNFIVFLVSAVSALILTVILVSLLIRTSLFVS